MHSEKTKRKVAETAHVTAWARSLGRLTEQGAPANGDYLAERFLLPYQRVLNHAPRLVRWLMERATPGAYGYFNARTRYFDELLEAELARGLAQLVLLGAGFDSRPVRFARALADTKVFEVDMPEVLRVRRERLASLVTAHDARVAVPIDFEHEELGAVLRRHGYDASRARTFFLWEGVTYYLPLRAVEGVLASVAALTVPGASLAFDYVTRAFFEGDHASYGARGLADAWRSLGDVHRSGIEDAGALLAAHGFALRTLTTPEELEARYLSRLPAGAVRAWARCASRTPSVRDRRGSADREHARQVRWPPIRGHRCGIMSRQRRAEPALYSFWP